MMIKLTLRPTLFVRLLETTGCVNRFPVCFSESDRKSEAPRSFGSACLSRSWRTRVLRLGDPQMGARLTLRHLEGAIIGHNLDRTRAEGIVRDSSSFGRFLNLISNCVV